MSILRTRQRRPDLYKKLDLSSREDRKLLKELEEEGEGAGSAPPRFSGTTHFLRTGRVGARPLQKILQWTPPEKNGLAFSSKTGYNQEQHCKLRRRLE